jgi:hypothetical protein
LLLKQLGVFNYFCLRFSAALPAFGNTFVIVSVGLCLLAKLGKFDAVDALNGFRASYGCWFCPGQWRLAHRTFSLMDTWSWLSRFHEAEVLLLIAVLVSMTMALT